MIEVTIRLISAVTHRTSEIGRMYLANVGGDHRRGDYDVAVCRRGSTDVPAPVDPGGPKPTRSGRVTGYPRLAYNVWRLITRGLLTAFPEERKLAQVATSGDDASEGTEATDEQALELGREILRDAQVMLRYHDLVLADEDVADIGRRAWRRGARPNGMPEVG